MAMNLGFSPMCDTQREPQESLVRGQEERGLRPNNLGNASHYLGGSWRITEHFGKLKSLRKPAGMELVKFCVSQRLLNGSILPRAIGN